MENRKEKAVKYRLEKLNQVQYADDEVRRKELEAKGFRVVSKAADSGSENFEAENSVKKSEATKKTKAAKKAEVERKTEPVEEGKDAG